jgi:hypothetical protein
MKRCRQTFFLADRLDDRAMSNASILMVLSKTTFLFIPHFHLIALSFYRVIFREHGFPQLFSSNTSRFYLSPSPGSPLCRLKYQKILAFASYYGYNNNRNYLSSKSPR